MALPQETYGNNPIAWVGSSSHPIKCPSVFQVEIEDISSSDAGRTEDGTMHKNRLVDKNGNPVQARSISLEWHYLTTAEVSAILTAFNPEYINVRYLDPLVGGYTTKEFYVGNRPVPMYNCARDRWTNLSFNIITRK